MNCLFQSSLLEYQVANTLILQIRKLRAECAETHNSCLLGASETEPKSVRLLRLTFVIAVMH